MTRRLLNLLAALSLLLCVAVIALWVRNGWRAESLRFNGDGVRVSIISADGSIGVAKWQAPTATPSAHGRWHYWPTPTPWVLQDHPLPDRGPRGFAWGRVADDGFGAEWWVAAPHWCLAAVLALPVVAWACARVRRLRNLVTVLSLLLCVAAVVLWVRSYWVGETWDWCGWKGTRDATLASARGQLSIRRFGPRLGLALVLQLPDPNGTNHVEAMVPYWLVTLALAVPPVLWLRSRWRRRRGPPVCEECGYDLRATPERCPECGTLARGVRCQWDFGSVIPGRKRVAAS